MFQPLPLYDLTGHDTGSIDTNHDLFIPGRCICTLHDAVTGIKCIRISGNNETGSGPVRKSRRVRGVGKDANPVVRMFGNSYGKILAV